MRRGQGIEMNLYLTNTLTRKKEPFRNRQGNKVKIFTCGPSIYRYPHVGNYATFLYEDILHRYLEYLGYRVERLMNFTDVEDKAIEEARKKGLTLEELTQPVVEQFFRDRDLLRLKIPEPIPRSSTSVEQAVHLIKLLLERGYAYWHGRDVFFDPLKFEGFGKLYGLDMSRWPKKRRRFRRDNYPGSRWNLGDFILWHGDGDEDGHFLWETDLGIGRPAWNIQDPAMITKHLGYQVDIACGGADNLYRHHDYSIAVIEAISHKTFATYWLHGEHVLADGAKMSKSKGNIVYPKDFLMRGFEGDHIRFFLIYGHYRQKTNFSWESFQESVGMLTSLQGMVQKVTEETGAKRPDSGTEALIRELKGTFEERMSDDLDVKGAVDVLHRNLSRLTALKMEEGLGRKETRKIRDIIKDIDGVLQVLGL